MASSVKIAVVVSELEANTLSRVQRDAGSHSLSMRRSPDLSQIFVSANERDEKMAASCVVVGSITLYRRDPNIASHTNIYIEFVKSMEEYGFTTVDNTMLIAWRQNNK